MGYCLLSHLYCYSSLSISMSYRVLATSCYSTYAAIAPVLLFISIHIYEL